MPTQKVLFDLKLNILAWFYYSYISFFIPLHLKGWKETFQHFQNETLNSENVTISEPFTPPSHFLFQMKLFSKYLSQTWRHQMLLPAQGRHLFPVFFSKFTNHWKNVSQGRPQVFLDTKVVFGRFLCSHDFCTYCFIINPSTCHTSQRSDSQLE